MKNPLLQRPSAQGVNELGASHRQPSKKGPQRHPKCDAASEALKSWEGDNAAGVSPCRGRLICVGADTPITSHDSQKV